MSDSAARSALIADGRAVLGIELGSTRIKAVLVDEADAPVASGVHEWENTLRDGVWTYALDDVHAGLRAAYTALVDDVRERYGVVPTGYRAMGVSAMMHGYLAFDADGGLLVPFRTWRNTSTGDAAARLTDALGVNIPLRWSVAHLLQAVLDGEEHVGRVASLTTLAGYVHRRLTGRHVLGVGDASGVFPVDGTDWDRARLATTQELLGDAVPDLAGLLPEVLGAGREAGTLTADGAALLDPSGALQPGVPLCPPEGDAGTGMVATGAVAPRTGNVSVGTSIFAMVVLERPLDAVHPEVDIVMTPAGDPVAMVHCNNGASEVATWAVVFGRFAAASGSSATVDDVYRVLLDEALAADPDAGGLLAYNAVAGEPITGTDEGRPLVVRAPDSRLTLGNLVRAEVFAAFAALAVGMRVLDAEDVRVDRLLAHGGLFRTPGAGQRLLAAALGTSVAVRDTAGEGGAWGMAVLAGYLGRDEPLDTYLADTVFAGSDAHEVAPDAADVAGFGAFLDRYRAGLPLQRAAADALALRDGHRTTPDRSATSPAERDTRSAERGAGAEHHESATDPAERAPGLQAATEATR